MILLLQLSFLFLLLFWIVGFSLRSIFPGLEFSHLSYPFLSQIYSTVCHQNDQKIFTVNGNEFLVCARCTGIYIGSISALLVSFIKIFKIKDNIILVSAIILLLDVFLSTSNIYVYNKGLSFLTGFLFGASIFFYILSIVSENLSLRKV